MNNPKVWVDLKENNYCGHIFLLNLINVEFELLCKDRIKSGDQDFTSMMMDKIPKTFPDYPKFLGENKLNLHIRLEIKM